MLGTPNPAASSGNAGRYMSMANGLTTLSAPSREITNRPDRLAWGPTAAVDNGVAREIQLVSHEVFGDRSSLNGFGTARGYGKRNSRISGSVRRVLVMWVCTASVPAKPGPAGEPEQIVS